MGCLPPHMAQEHGAMRHGLGYFEDAMMAKFSPGKFVREVRQEANKIVWPTPRETTATTIMVLIMTAILAIFFLGIDSAFGALVNWLLSFAQ